MAEVTLLEEMIAETTDNALLLGNLISYLTIYHLVFNLAELLVVPTCILHDIQEFFSVYLHDCRVVFAVTLDRLLTSSEERECSEYLSRFQCC